MAQTLQILYLDRHLLILIPNLYSPNAVRERKFRANPRTELANCAGKIESPMQMNLHYELEDETFFQEPVQRGVSKVRLLAGYKEFKMEGIKQNADASRK